VYNYPNFENRAICQITYGSWSNRNRSYEAACGRLGGNPVGGAAAGSPAATRAGGYQQVVGEDPSTAAPQGEVLIDPPMGAFAPSPPVQVDPAALQQLQQMGFSEARARDALLATRNNVSAATNLLLGA
jgi:hypothetical protein